ncbi:MAG TPA: hypothetical protein VKB38_19745 [Terracidiphilus sp.]|nr:hypothetical protein [Terracidiphilus sp.]
MPQSDTRTEVFNTINRCNEAWNKAKNQPGADEDTQQESATWAFLDQLPVLHDPQSFQVYTACIAHGVTLGVIDVVDIGRYGHLVQLAMSTWKLANPDWKNPQKQDPLPPTKGNHEVAEERSGALDPSHLGTREGRQTPTQPSAEPENTHPLPPNGNHSEDEKQLGAPGPSPLGTREGSPTADHNHFEDESSRIAASCLPDFDTQKALFKELRRQGFSLPSNSHLQRNPVEALYYCGMAGLRFDGQPSAQANQAA